MPLLDLDRDCQLNITDIDIGSMQGSVRGYPGGVHPHAPATQAEVPGHLPDRFLALLEVLDKLLVIARH
jgi:hypothetical protein